MFQRLGRRADGCSRGARGCSCSGRCGSFQLLAGAALGADAPVEGVGGQSGGVAAWDVNGTGARAGVTLTAAGVAHQAAHGVHGRQVALQPALHPLLLVFDGVPGEEDEEEAQEFEAGGEAEVDEAQRGDVVLPAGAVDATVLLPQHAGGVDDCTKVDGSGDVGWGGGGRGGFGAKRERIIRLWTRRYSWFFILFFFYSPRVLRRTNCIPRANGRSCSATDL